MKRLYRDRGKNLKEVETTVSLVYIGRQVIRESIMHLFPVGGVHPRIYFPWEVGSPPTDTIFFFQEVERSNDEEMVGDRETGWSVCIIHDIINYMIYDYTQSLSSSR